MYDCYPNVLHHRDLTIQDSDTVGVALEQYRPSPALGFSNCLILEVAEKPVTFFATLTELLKIRWSRTAVFSSALTHPLTNGAASEQSSEFVLSFTSSCTVTRHADVPVRACLDHSWPVEYLEVEPEFWSTGACNVSKNDAYFRS